MKNGRVMTVLNERGTVRTWKRDFSIFEINISTFLQRKIVWKYWKNSSPILWRWGWLWPDSLPTHSSHPAFSKHNKAKFFIFISCWPFSFSFPSTALIPIAGFRLFSGKSMENEIHRYTIFVTFTMNDRFQLFIFL